MKVDLPLVRFAGLAGAMVVDVGCGHDGTLAGGVERVPWVDEAGRWTVDFGAFQCECDVEGGSIEVRGCAIENEGAGGVLL